MSRAHRRRIVEAQREQREDVAHAAVRRPRCPPTARSGSRWTRRRARRARPSAAPRSCGSASPGRPCARKCRTHASITRAKRVERRPAVGEADHRVVLRLALPVERGVGASRAHRGRPCRARPAPRRSGARCCRSDGPTACISTVSRSASSTWPSWIVAFCSRKKSSRRAQPQRVVGAVEHVAQDHVRELVDEHRRHVDRRP